MRAAPLVVHFCAMALVVITPPLAFGQASISVVDVLQRNQSDLSTAGRSLLLKEAADASFFLIGGLHGDNETQGLITSLWPEMQKVAYRYISVEMSPWAAARFGAALKTSDLRGTDIEELQPHLLIRDLAAANPQNPALQSMTALVKAGYRQSLASELLQLARQAGELKDRPAGGISLYTQILRTLEVDVARSARADTTTRQDASAIRETAMKEFFLTHYRASAQDATKPKVVAVFGRNHLHRGYDRRGVSTLGNFIAELAVAEGARSFHLAIFAAGGRISLNGVRVFDERKSDPAFALLASVARYPATVFDLRPVRQALRQLPTDKLSSRDAGLLYWADSYDAILCFREVTPLALPAR